MSDQPHGTVAAPHSDEPLDPNQVLWIPPTPPEVPVDSGDEPKPARWRSRLVPHTLTARLVTGVVSLIVVVLAITSGTTYALLRPYLQDKLDQQVTNVAEQTAASLHCGPLQCGFNTGGFGPSEKQWITIVNGQKVVALKLPSTSSSGHNKVVVMELSTSALTRVLDAQSNAITVTTTDGYQLRVSAAHVPTTPLTMIVGFSTSDEHNTLHRLLAIELGIGGAAILLAIMATTAGVRFGLRPLYRVTRTAQEVSAELSPDGAGLDRRVPVADRDRQTEVGQLAESVNTMLGAVETQFAARVASEARMRQFLADASHELRTPLTTIRGYSELARMRRAIGDADDPETLDRIESEGTRMSRLVDDLLTLARSDQGHPPERQRLDVADLVDDVVAGVRAAHPERRIDMVVPNGLSVSADPDQLVRVLRNLVTNAAVHTAPDGPIRVSARHLGGQIEFQIADSGPGLHPDEAAHVFERFWRADKARTRVRGGSGLGLAIVSSIVEAHGGTVAFASTVETGSTVTVLLPAD